MKKLVFKKFLSDVSAFFLVSLLIMGLIVWTMQAINYFDFVSKDGHGLKVYFLYTLLNFPKIIHRIIPFMFFLSLFYTIIKYENNNELNIFWINGISKTKFINIILIFSIFLMVIQIFLGSYLSPLSQLKARYLIKNSNSDFLTNLINEGKFINAVNGLTIYLEKKNQDNFSNIFIDDSTKVYSRMIYAKTGKLANNQNNKKFILYNGEVINIDDTRLNVFKFDQIDFDLETFGTNSITKPKIQEISSNILLSCNFKNFFSSHDYCKNNESISEIKQELLKRFFKPIYIPVISLICCFLFFSGKLLANYEITKKLVFIFIFIIIIISESSLRYSTTSDISLLIYLLIPIILFSIFYLITHLKINNA
jgi:lipopolysaccharide export system permease protein